MIAPATWIGHHRPPKKNSHNTPDMPTVLGLGALALVIQAWCAESSTNAFKADLQVHELRVVGRAKGREGERKEGKKIVIAAALACRIPALTVLTPYRDGGEMRKRMRNGAYTDKNCREGPVELESLYGCPSPILR